jgi:glycosyltransferase involved in cell wall biosynthesis
MSTEFSFIIPTLNEGKYIEGCLRSIRKQKESYEIIVVDSYSKDNTVKIARKYGKVVFEGRKGPAVARNTGARKAKGRILVFPDADIKFDKDFLTRLKLQFGDAGGGIFNLTFFDPNSFSDLLFFRIWNKIIKLLIRCGLVITNGSCFAFEKKIFKKVGGFNPDLLTNEDHDLAIRVSRYKKFRFFDVPVYTSVRRMKRLGLMKFLKLHIKATLFYFLFHRSLAEYWQ